ncbi:hypothetical protein T459_25014 [Capsicum annuum]|uniref:Ubiquitin-like protease family profile domain-containing protein n=1 Tax=Capsicum annuum TaxID=4072 RepID=A0A2G2YJJ8_CAPAN|nr:hypothetical protein T459_25014 [Capsicum annuum]
MNNKFSEVLKSLQQKNETVEKEKFAKQSPKEGQHSNDVADFEDHSNSISPHFILKKTEKTESRQEYDPSDDVVDHAGHTSTDNVVKETDKPVEMEEDKTNQAPSFCKNGEQHEKDAAIENQSDIVVEEMQLLDSIIPGREHDMALTIYKPSPTTLVEYMISDTHKVPTDWAASKSYKEKTEDCGVFVAVYAENLSEGLGISCSGIDAQYHHLRYITLLCKYGSEKVENNYFSKNDDPPRPRSKSHQKKQTVFCILRSYLFV